MDTTAIVIIVLFVVVAVALFIKDKKNKDRRKKVNDAVDAAAAEAWKTDYHNPNSPTYDPVRVAAEEEEFRRANGLL